MGYLEDLIRGQTLRQNEIDTLRSTRDKIESDLRGNWNTGDPNFYYGGSFAKNTMIRASYDLDLVVYFPSTATNYSLKVLYEAIEKRLKDRGYTTTRKNVAVRLPYEAGFNIDVVPGRALDYTFYDANLYSSERDTSKKTSIKTHIDLVRKNGGYQDVIKLLKLWKVRNNLNIGSFPLEIATSKALYGIRGDLSDRLWTVLQYLNNSFTTARLEDPANSSNVVSDDIPYSTKIAVSNAAYTSCSKRNWNEIVW